ncbi:gas vesicle protein GvpG [Ammoniphilus sp. YIM 78166]|uniref:gas vesicle protein GvpG n=1 Tax=Ammoniphilus sp. YIM 78166 TaxID=1644106 RepID=UPI00106F586C|nr:gas vesicle protein GvpG [Ammoniphilus sp. YIM 78166]
MIHKLFTLPIRALLVLGEKVQEEAENELYNIQKLQQQLIQLHMMYENGEIAQNLYQQKEQELLQRYKKAKDREKS